MRASPKAHGARWTRQGCRRGPASMPSGLVCSERKRNPDEKLGLLTGVPVQAVRTAAWPTCRRHSSGLGALPQSGPGVTIHPITYADIGRSEPYVVHRTLGSPSNGSPSAEHGRRQHTGVLVPDSNHCGDRANRLVHLIICNVEARRLKVILRSLSFGSSATRNLTDYCTF